jgi:hypothetical protein
MRPVLGLLASLSLVHLGCSAEIASASRSDAGAPLADAATVADAASVADAAPTADAATAFDASPNADSATPVDAALTADAATSVDAAPIADAGPCPVPLDATVSATMTITADDHFKLYVNGAIIDETARTWSSVQTYALTLFRHPTRKNVIAIEGINAAKIDGFDRGIVADLALSESVPGAGTSNPSSPVRIVTDATWKVATTLAAGWNTVAFDDTAWNAATAQGTNGMGPWGAVLGPSSASWIWSYASSGSAASKTTTETIYVRKSFYFTRDLVVSTAPSACP